MAFDPIADLQALKDELVNDPTGVGYQGGGTDHAFDAIDAAIISDPALGRTVNQLTVDTAAVRAATTYDAFEGLSAAEETWFTWLTQNGEITVNDDTLANLAGIGGASRWAVADRPTMEPRMQALMQTTGSRAEELWGIGSNITPSYIAQAVDLP